MNKILLIIVLVFVIFMFKGCSGCSQSGIRDKQKEIKYSNKKQITPKVVDHAIMEKNAEENPLISLSNNPLSLNELFKKHKSAVFLITTTDGNNLMQGSGFFVTPDGIGVSNYHVFEGMSKGLENIILESGEKFKISEVLSSNKDKDFIIFKVELNRTNNFFNVASTISEIGDQVFAIGNPKGLDHTLSTGIISGYRQDNLYIQTTTEITHGSSGGPLINMKGDVIGITTAGFGEANLNFAVNIQAVFKEK